MKSIINGPDQIPIHIVRNKKNKNMRLVYKQDHFRLSIPLLTKPTEIQSFLKRCQSWMDKQIKKEKLTPTQLPKKTYSPGDKIQILGKEYTLVFKKDLKKSMTVLEDIIEVTGPTETFLPILKSGLIDLISKILNQRTFVYASTIGKSVNKITIKDTSSRWGSCSSRGNINYCWRIVFAPSEVVDYLCAHEVAHLIEMNHSVRFWSIVKALCPDYLKNRQWLKKNGKNLTFC